MAGVEPATSSVKAGALPNELHHGIDGRIRTCILRRSVRCSTLEPHRSPSPSSPAQAYANRKAARTGGGVSTSRRLGSGAPKRDAPYGWNHPVEATGDAPDCCDHASICCKYGAIRIGRERHKVDFLYRQMPYRCGTGAIHFLYRCHTGAIQGKSQRQSRSRSPYQNIARRSRGMRNQSPPGNCGVGARARSSQLPTSPAMASAAILPPIVAM